MKCQCCLSLGGELSTDLKHKPTQTPPRSSSAIPPCVSPLLHLLTHCGLTFSSHSLADVLIDFTEVLCASCFLHLVGIFQSFPYQASLPQVSLLFVFLLDIVDCQGVSTCPWFRALCHPPLVLSVTQSVILGPLSSVELVLKLPHPPLNPLFFLDPVWWHHVPSQKSGSLPTTSSPTSCDEKLPDSISSMYQVYPLFKKKKKKHVYSFHSNPLGFSLTMAFGLPPVLFP